MLNRSAKRPIVLVLAGIMLFTFCAVAPPADAAVLFLVPAVVAGAVAVVGGIVTAVKKSMDQAGEKKATREEKTRGTKTAGELEPLGAELQEGQG